MFNNYLKIAWRNLTKNKVYFVINILGLSMALTASFLMLLWVYDEYTIDKFHANDERLFQVKRTIPLENGVIDVYETVPYQLLKTGKEQLPEIEKYITLGRSFEDNLKVENVDYRAAGTFTNADFFEGFSFPIILGDITQLDKKPEALAISETLARKIWGAEWKKKAIGSPVEIMDNGNFTVEAIFEDFPNNSSIQNDFYYSFNGYLAKNDWMLEWENGGMQGAFLLQEAADSDQVADKIQQLFQSNIEGEQKEGSFLQQFSDSYLYGKYDERAQVSGGRIEYVRIFAIAAIFLLLISCINFINLSTAYATKRATEIGVRKVNGANKKTLVRQFLTETGIVTSISFAIAFVLVLVLLPSVNEFVGKTMEIGFYRPGIWLTILAVFSITTLLSGMYPAYVISSFTTVDALKGKTQEKKNTISFRKGLVVLQFGLAVVMIVAAIIVKLQVDYINQKDLGIAKDHIVSMHQDQKLTEKYEVLRNELLSSNTIEDVTLAGPFPLDMGASTSGVNWAGKTLDEQNIEFSLLWTAHNFPKTFDIPLSKGRYYPEGSADTLNIVVNEKAVETMGLTDPIGKTVEVWGSQRQIIGVLKDFHNRSLYEAIQPSIFFLDPNDAGTMFVKLKASKTEEALVHITTAFAKVLPDVPLHLDFVDAEYAAKYKSETLTGSLTYYFAFISILISCLGLFGLATFMAKQRTKEIGIRKVLGASVQSITTLISLDFLKLVGLAIVIASPLAYYLMNEWLQGFAYTVSISWWVFAITALLTVVIAFITIGFQSIKAAMVNPVKSLRTE
ncbi:FtsX-like permease family protein [Aggregatimonas sangjinii]|uniref:FtsX-like permease family protein n=1 Tax=Aggregatimonas sangjinii TaxID=2583587 RepID=A0A5B7SJS5_9FLAO|nr:ABC transporter permease [Aggregatimonas sangjinii]QCW98815.1 FtsX-like permease family protein [Aggregatimonas sangjinii]